MHPIPEPKPAKAHMGADFRAVVPPPSRSPWLSCLVFHQQHKKGIFLLSPSRPGEAAGSQALGTRSNCLGSPVLSKSSSKPFVPWQQPPQTAAGGWRGELGVPGDQSSPTSTKQERRHTVCAQSSPGHAFTAPFFPGSFGPRERDPMVDLAVLG